MISKISQTLSLKNPTSPKKLLIFGLLGITTAALLLKLVKLIKIKKQQNIMRLIANKKRQQRDKDIQTQKVPQIDIPADIKLKILNADVTHLLKLLESEQVTSEQILITYYQRAITIGIDLELLADVNFDQALEKARECDSLRKNNPTACKGVLFGIPISIKDTFDQEGLDSTMGYAAQCFKPCKDGFILKLLKAQGAIPFIRSNDPQGGMLPEAVNFIWGRSKNPWNKARTSGGSSGGEGGLIASRCSPLGLGSDIGGSIRYPSMFCGVYGLKSGMRLTTKGHSSLGDCYSGQINVVNSIGPLGRSVNDLALFSKAMLDEQVFFKFGPGERDVYLPFQAWNETKYRDDSKKRIGVLKELDFWGLSNANRRAISESVEALKKRGHEIIEVEMPVLEEAFTVWLQIFTAEGGVRAITDTSNGEQIIDEYAGRFESAGTSNWFLKLKARYSDIMGLKRLSSILKNTLTLNAYEYLLLSYKQQQLQEKFMKSWQDYNIDVLLVPGMSAALKHGYSKFLLPEAVYTMIANVMKLPAGAIPITRVRNDEQQYTKANSQKHWDVLSDIQSDNLQGSEGMPIGVQIMGLPYEDEKVLCVMRQLEEEIPFYKLNNFPY